MDIHGRRWEVNSQQTLEAFLDFIIKEWESKKYITIQWQSGKKRSNLQNNALHKYLTILAFELNSSGQDMKKVIKQNVDIPWTLETTKEFLWKPIQKALTGKESTADCSTDEYNKIYEVLNRHLAEKTGVSVAFPSREQD